MLDQAIGLAMYDQERYAELGRSATRQYLPTLLSFCPPEWSDRRKLGVSQMILGKLRGFLVSWRISGDVFDPMSGDTAAQAVRAIARDGPVALVGLASGQLLPLDPMDLLLRNYTVSGGLATPLDDPAAEAAVWAELVELATVVRPEGGNGPTGGPRGRTRLRSAGWPAPPAPR